VRLLKSLSNNFEKPDRCVLFDKQFKISSRVLIIDRSVWTNNRLIVFGALILCQQGRYVPFPLAYAAHNLPTPKKQPTSNLQSANMVLARQLKLEPLCIVGNGCNFHQLSLGSEIPVSPHIHQPIVKLTFKSTHSLSPFNVISGGGKTFAAGALSLFRY
jgi:hypothetical protein